MVEEVGRTKSEVVLRTQRAALPSDKHAVEEEKERLLGIPSDGKVRARPGHQLPFELLDCRGGR